MMGDMKRRHLPAISWHVMMRGARRLLLFRDDADRAAFLRILDESLKDESASLHAFVLMDNHYHLLVTAGWEELGRAMRLVNQRFSRGNNGKYGLKGHAFEGPYLAFPQPAAFWIARTSRYIDFNPVHAGIVRSPEQYRWSSCRAYSRGEAPPVPIDMGPVLKAFGGSRAAYRSFEPPSRRSKRVEATAHDVWREQVSWLIQFARERKDDLLGTSPQVSAAYWARRAGVPPRVIAEALGYPNGHTVSVLLSSVRQRIEERPALATSLHRADLGID